MLQYAYIYELYYRMFQDLAARGRRNHESLSTNLGPCFTVLSLPLGGCRECWLVSVTLSSKRHALIDGTGFLA